MRLRINVEESLTHSLIFVTWTKYEASEKIKLQQLKLLVGPISIEMLRKDIFSYFRIDISFSRFFSSDSLIHTKTRLLFRRFVIKIHTNIESCFFFFRSSAVLQQPLTEWQPFLMINSASQSFLLCIILKWAICIFNSFCFRHSTEATLT